MSDSNENLNSNNPVVTTTENPSVEEPTPTNNTSVVNTLSTISNGFNDLRNNRNFLIGAGSTVVAALSYLGYVYLKRR